MNNNDIEPSHSYCECTACYKLVPKPSGYMSEFSDYVLYFCGIDCYDEWQKLGYEVSNKNISVNENEIILNKTIGDLVKKHPDISTVFDDYDIDYCCGGDITLKETCIQKNIKSLTMINKIKSILSENHNHNLPKWDQLTLSELVDYITHKHHNYLHAAMPRIKVLIEKCVKAHSRNHPELKLVAEIYGHFHNEMIEHLAHEEEIVFPTLLQFESSHQFNNFYKKDFIRELLNELLIEHHGVGDDLKKLKKITQHYRVPEDACNTYRALLRELFELEKDTIQHIHIENNILFPRIINLMSVET